MSGTLLWDVDTQVDFIEPGTKLYFPGAEEARPAMGRLVEAARTAGIVHVASCDQHELSDPEISEQPDFESTWPPHCLLGTRGSETAPGRAAVGAGRAASSRRSSPRRAPPARREARDPDSEEAVRPVREPEHRDPARPARPRPDRPLRVATEICDDAAVRALVRRGRRIVFVEDASRGVDEARVAGCLAEWREAGVGFTSADDAISSLG